MDWVKFLRTKIYDKIYFLRYVFFLICLILTLLILINVFIYKKDPSNLIEINFVLNNIRDLFRNDSSLWAPEPILITLFTLLVFWVFIFLELIFRCTWKYFNSPSVWKLKDDFNFECLNELEIQGKIDTVNKSLRLTNSASGLLLKYKFWKDFEIKFKFNFEKLKIDKSPEVNWIKLEGQEMQILHKPRNNFFGLLFRARDLNNYFMISIGIKQIIKEEQSKNTLAKNPYDLKMLITPHIKVDGNWEVFESDEFDPLDVNIEKDNQVTCRLEGNILTLNIGKAVKNYQWILPSKFRMNWIGEPTGMVDSNKRESVIGDPSTITFRGSYGMIGFRAYGKEHVIISKIIITKLDSF